MQVGTSDFNYDLLVTKDGSPTISLHSQNNECMHHRDGAFTESIYIYGYALEKITYPQPAVMSVGLGLGYNELITVAHFLSRRNCDDFYLESFEVEPALRQYFLAWLQDQAPLAWSEVYDLILNKTAEHYGLLPGLIKQQLLEMYLSKKWSLREALDPHTQFDRQFHVIFFDAFSKGTTPALWDEEFLTQFLAKVTTTPCALTTYAATGSLTRALKKNQFEVDLRKGFSGKRQSTLALK